MQRLETLFATFEISLLLLDLVLKVLFVGLQFPALLLKGVYVFLDSSDGLTNGPETFDGKDGQQGRGEEREGEGKGKAPQTSKLRAEQP